MPDKIVVPDFLLGEINRLEGMLKLHESKLQRAIEREDSQQFDYCISAVEYFRQALGNAVLAAMQITAPFTPAKNKAVAPKTLVIVDNTQKRSTIAELYPNAILATWESFNED